MLGYALPTLNVAATAAPALSPVRSAASELLASRHQPVGNPRYSTPAPAQTPPGPIAETAHWQRPAPLAAPVVAAAAPAPAPAPAPDGVPTANIRQVIQGSATSYCLTGHTATGTNAGPGSIAVDPTVIPLGSHLYVTGYGYGWAVDTGGAIKGTLIDVWYTCDAAIRWGRRAVTIYVLTA